MPKKRSSRGRAKGDKGRSDYVQCSYCGAQVPRDKAKRITTWPSYLDPQLRSELKQKGVRISLAKTVKYLCISCAVHRGVVKVRSKEERRLRGRRRRR